MKTRGTDRLIADVLALSLEIRQHLEDGRRHLTPLQIEALSNALTSLSNYFAAWKGYELSGRNALERNGNCSHNEFVGIP